MVERSPIVTKRESDRTEERLRTRVATAESRVVNSISGQGRYWRGRAVAVAEDVGFAG